MDRFFGTIEAIAGLIVAVALVSVVVSKRAQSPQVIQSAGSAFSNALAVAEAPVTGARMSIDLSYPGDGHALDNPFSAGF